MDKLNTKKKLSPEHCRKISEGQKGRRHSEATRQKISQSRKAQPSPMKGKEQSAQAVANNRRAHLGLKRSPEAIAKQKLSAPKTHSLEHNQKVSAALKGRKPSPYTIQRAIEVNRSRIRSPEENKSRGRPGRKPSEETRRKISEGQKGKVISQETRAKISATLKAKGTNTPESVAKIKAFWANLTLEEKQAILSKRKFKTKRSFTSIELKIKFLLDLNDVPYYSSFKLGPFTLDFYLPTLNLDLECDGSYWHSLPTYQELDPRRDKWMHDRGIRVLRLPENVINKMDYGDLFRCLVNCNTIDGLNVPQTKVN